MADKGFNFRNTAGFVTDGVEEVHVPGETIYPTTLNGVTCGWTGGVADRDRDAGIDRRLAGTNQTNDASDAGEEFRIDLAAGDYDLEIAAGGINAGTNALTILDNATSLFALTGTYSTYQWEDATGTLRTSAADWVANQTARRVTISSGILIVRFDTHNPAKINHLAYTAAGASDVDTTLPAAGDLSLTAGAISATAERTFQGVARLDGVVQAGAEVYLIDRGSGTLADTVTTDGGGVYTFENVAPGRYLISGALDGATPDGHLVEMG